MHVSYSFRWKQQVPAPRIEAYVLLRVGKIAAQLRQGPFCNLLRLDLLLARASGAFALVNALHGCTCAWATLLPKPKLLGSVGAF